ncbi:MAG: ABC transporter permease [Candidatus Heimdallarchaeota archaeon]|nr:ABC transporter permease [Candidatus Heimdallarchaeota archaeon]
MLFVKKIIRDLSTNKSRSVPVIILIIVSQMASVLYIEFGIIIDVSKDRYYDEVNLADVWIDTLPITSAVFNETIINNWKDGFDIDYVQTRLFFQGNIEIEGEKIPIDIIGHPEDQQAAVSRIITADDSYFDDVQNLSNAVFIERAYMKYYKISRNSSLAVRCSCGIETFNFTLKVLGGANSAEYPLTPGEGALQFANSANFAPFLRMSVFVRNDFLQEHIFESKEFYNQICVSIQEKESIPAFIRSLKQDSSNFGYSILAIREYPNLMEDMIDMMVGVGWGLALFFLIISLFVTYTIINRFIKEQRPHIGIMKALGYNNTSIYIRTFYYGLILGSSSIIGIIIGVLLSFGIIDLGIDTWLSLPYKIISIPFLQYIVLVLATIICSLIACFFSARNVVKISPQAAVRPEIAERDVKSFFVENFIQKIFRCQLNPQIKYSIRNVFTNPKRSINTTIILLMAVSLFGAFFTIIATVSGGSTQMFIYEQWDAQINLNQPQQFSDFESSLLNKLNITKPIIIEPMLVDIARLYQKDTWSKITFTALINQSRLKRFEGIDTGFRNNLSAIVSPDLATLYGLNEGENYKIGGRNGTEYQITIQKVLSTQLSSGFFIPLEIGRLLSFGNDIDDQVNMVLMGDIEDSFFENSVILSMSEIQSIILKSELIDEMDVYNFRIQAVMAAILGLLIIIAAIIIYSIMTINIAERKIDLIILKTLGVHNRVLYLWGGVEALFYSLLASLGYFIGYLASNWYMGILQDLMERPLVTPLLSFEHYILCLILVIIAAYAGQFFALYQVLKQRIALVVKEKLFA